MLQSALLTIREKNAIVFLPLKLRIYFDPSVFSAYDDDRLTDRRYQTEEFWVRLDAFEAATSELAREA
jgi:hypothetical protein